jgi:hypothetical protein
MEESNEGGAYPSWIVQPQKKKKKKKKNYRNTSLSSSHKNISDGGHVTTFLESY